MVVGVDRVAAIKAKWPERRKAALPTAVPPPGYYMPASWSIRPRCGRAGFTGKSFRQRSWEKKIPRNENIPLM